MDSACRDAWLKLTLTPGLGPTLTLRAVQALGSPSAVVEASVAQLAGIEGIGRQRAEAFRRSFDELASGPAVAREVELMEQFGAHLLVRDQPGYPPLLAHISDAPPVLFVQGEIAATDAVALAIVGSRKCSSYGREQADRFAALAAQAGLCIVSGGAYGIDAAAHRAVLRAGGRTLVVLGSGLARPYPAEHADLFAQIAEGPGAIISELPMSAPPVAENFPRRNRIISGLALGVLVIEAAVKSGALITARLAAEEHHREVMALPGRVDAAASAGCHKIIREGWATLVTNLAEVLDALGDTGHLLKAGLTHVPGDSPVSPAQGQGEGASVPDLFAGAAASVAAVLTESQTKIITALEDALPVETIAARTGLTISGIQADLTMLQIRGLVQRDAGRFVRARARENRS